MLRKTHKEIVKFHKDIAKYHVDIKGFYRFNVNEIIGQFRSGIQTPALLLESHSSELESQTKMVSNFNKRCISFLILDFAGQPNDFDKQDQVLDDLEHIALDIPSYFAQLNKTKDSFLFNAFDINNYKYEKVGPLFDNMYGWNILYNFKNHESMVLNPAKWNFNP